MIPFFGFTYKRCLQKEKENKQHDEIEIYISFKKESF